MPAPFPENQIVRLKKELFNLYVTKNMSLREVARFLGMSEGGVYKRLKKFKIPIEPFKKKKFLNEKPIHIPQKSSELAEFIGILLGDGHITRTQVWVTSHMLDDRDYHTYIKNLATQLFYRKAKSLVDEKDSVVEMYIGSVRLVRFFKQMGLVENKVKEQVKIPQWVFLRKKYQKACLKGLIDTDGSVYKLKSGNPQISFKNFSFPLLRGVREMLSNLKFNPSQISSNTVYLSRKAELERYFRDVGTSNAKHLYRYLKFKGGSHSGNCTRL